MLIEAVVVVFSAHTILATGHFSPPHEFQSVRECMDWLDSEEGDRAWHELGAGFQAFYAHPVETIPACFRRNEA